VSVHKFDATPERFVLLAVDGALMRQPRRATLMNSIIYIVGVIVIVMAILSFIGLA
jgi:hypothetical protein